MTLALSFASGRRSWRACGNNLELDKWARGAEVLDVAGLGRANAEAGKPPGVKSRPTRKIHNL